MKQIDFRKKGNKQSYLRYSDVFMSRGGGGGANNRNYKEAGRTNELRPPPPADRQSDRIYRQYGNDEVRQREDQYVDHYEEYDEDPQPEDEQIYDKRPLNPYEREYFSQENNIIDDRMIKYQKRQLPPLHRYGNGANSRNNYPIQRSMYWDEDEETNGYARRRKSYPSLGALWHKFIVTFASIISLVCLTWIAYNWNGNHKGDATGRNGPVIIEPINSEFKVLPEEPGGSEIEHVNKTVYNRLTPESSVLDPEESLLPPQEDPVYLPDRRQISSSTTNQDIEEYAILDDKKYYIKISAGKSRGILEKEEALLKKKYSQLLTSTQCAVKKVSNSQGEQKYAILIGPFETQSNALTVAQSIGGQCYIVTVKD
ncbi:MAG: SPOR domain-containing protein [Holosporales bacterium]|jgi:hypothetical protein|nr:SPOR domain-containing protein [Holosporales bacterium]